MHWKPGLSALTGSAATAFGALALASLAAPAVAHHSYSMFDMKKAMAIEGRVAKLEWTNPHISLWLYVPKAGQRGSLIFGASRAIRRAWPRVTAGPSPR
jgi:hypothetical protein